MILSELIPFLKKIGATPKRGLSQNFLIDPNIVRKIIQTAEVKPEDMILEIGPGPGALTSALLASGARVYAIEKDPVFARELSRLQNGKLTIFEADFLKFPLHHLPAGMKIVANLPYHITAPILEKVFLYPFSSLVVMVQKEVAARMTAQAGSKIFSSLSLFVQFHADCPSFFPVPAACFYPKPKVDSTVIRLDCKNPPAEESARLFRFIRKGFQQRRKMIANSLNLPKDQVKTALSALGLRADARPESLSLDRWILLAKELSDFFLQDEEESSLHLFQSDQIPFLQK